MAPEILGGARFTERADVYSFAMVAWEVLTLKPNSNPHPHPHPNPNPHPNPSPRPNQVLTHSLPFTGMNPVQIGLAVREQKLRPPLPDDCPAGFGTLLRDCWHDEPEQRHAFAVVLGRLQAIEMLREFDGLAELPT